jgi:hypothetical protein
MSVITEKREENKGFRERGGEVRYPGKSVPPKRL